MGRLERKLDSDLIERMEAGWTPSSRATPLKKAKQPRAASTYRSVRRNAYLRVPPKSVWPKNNLATYVPYETKPFFVFRYRNGVLKRVLNKQPKIYPYSSERQNTREKRRMERLQQRAV
jgi:hypothetical protein